MLFKTAVILILFFCRAVFAADCSAFESIYAFVACNSAELKRERDALAAAFETAFASQPDPQKAERMLSEYEAFERRLDCRTTACLKKAYRDYAERLANAAPLPSPLPDKLSDLPENVDVLVFSQYGGREKTEEFVLGAHETVVSRLYVNLPHKKTVLVLSAYEPTLWEVYTAPDTEIAGIYASGYYGQAVRGYPDPKTPVAFGDKYAETRKEAAELLKKAGMKSEKFAFFKDTFSFGEALPKERYAYVKTNFSGRPIQTDRLPDRQGIRQLVGEGVLLPVTKSFAAVLNKTGAGRYRLAEFPFDRGDDGRVFDFSPFSAADWDADGRQLLFKELESLPTGLGGSHSIDLYVPKDLRPPKNPGHSRMFVLNKTREELGLPFKKAATCAEEPYIVDAAVCYDAGLKKAAKKLRKKTKKRDFISDTAEAKFKAEELKCRDMPCLRRLYNVKTPDAEKVFPFVRPNENDPLFHEKDEIYNAAAFYAYYVDADKALSFKRSYAEDAAKGVPEKKALKRLRRNLDARHFFFSEYSFSETAENRSSKCNKMLKKEAFSKTKPPRGYSYSDGEGRTYSFLSLFGAKLTEKGKTRTVKINAPFFHEGNGVSFFEFQDGLFISYPDKKGVSAYEFDPEFLFYKEACRFDAESGGVDVVSGSDAACVAVARNEYDDLPFVNAASLMKGEAYGKFRDRVCADGRGRGKMTPAERKKKRTECASPTSFFAAAVQTDIDNDGKEELFVRGGRVYDAERGTIARIVYDPSPSQGTETAVSVGGKRYVMIVENGFPTHLYAVGRDAESGYKAVPICVFKPKIVYK